jgi:hypothetical protein
MFISIQYVDNTQQHYKNKGTTIMFKSNVAIVQ